MALPEARVMTIEGVRVRVIERNPPIPPSLALLLNGGRGPDGRLWQPVRVAMRWPLVLGGARAECVQQDHRLRPWVEGFHSGSDGLARYLSLQACADCGAVCVRDRSVDTLDGLSAGRRPLRRRDEVIGWYSGARRNQRVYT